jgi:hypothetical protein
MWLLLVAVGCCWSLLLPTCRSQLYDGDELVILAVVPSSEGDDVIGDLSTDGVVEGSGLVVEELGGVRRESRDGGGVDQARCVGIHILNEGGSANDTGAVGGGEVDQVGS